MESPKFGVPQGSLLGLQPYCKPTSQSEAPAGDVALCVCEVVGGVSVDQVHGADVETVQVSRLVQLNETDVVRVPAVIVTRVKVWVLEP